MPGTEMSEYQYYDFRAIDRSLTKDGMAELRRLTSRANITPTRLQNVYHWGGFRGDPEALMEEYFDLLVVVPDTAPEERKRSRLAYERLWETGTAADILVWTRRRFEERTHLRVSLPGIILQEGRLLYAA